jgi:hypothetical protein
MPVILTTQRQRSGGSWFKVSPNSKKNHKKRREEASGVAQGIGPEFKPQHCQKKKKCNRIP